MSIQDYYITSGTFSDPDPNYTGLSLAFGAQPTNTNPGQVINPAISVDVINDWTGAIYPIGNYQVMLSIANGPAGATLNDTAATNGGVATFSGISFVIPGNYTLQAADGAIPAALSNNFNISGPDLSGQFTGKIPSTATAGSKVSPQLEISDSMAAADGTEVTDYYLSNMPGLSGTYSLLSPEDYQLNLQVGKSTTEPFNLTIPAATASGTYYLVAQIDADGAIEGEPGEIVHSGPIRISGDDLQILDVSDSGVVPAQATDLNVRELFGLEQIQVPVMVTNIGSEEAKGTLGLSLSTTNTGSGASVSLKIDSATPSKVDLMGGADQDYIVTATVPTTGLVAGTQYYVLATLQESSPNSGPQAKSVCATSGTFEFVGTPTANPAVFENGTYFGFIRDLFHYQNGTGTLALNSQSNSASPSDSLSFIQAWEGDSQSPYKVSGVPHIGVGINLNTVSGQLMTDLANDARPNLPAKFAKASAPAVIAELQKLAGPRAPKLISVAQDQLLFEEAVNDALNVVKMPGVLGSFWSNLTTEAQIAILDMVYNLGSLTKFPSFVAALKRPGGPDYLRAAFELVDAVRTTQLLKRTEGDFEELLLNSDALGQLV